VQEGVVDSDPEAIASFVRSKAPGTVRIGIETGPTTTWLWTELKRLGLPVICIDARHAKAVLKMQINKSDRNDAAGIARIMQTGRFKEVRVKDCGWPMNPRQIESQVPGGVLMGLSYALFEDRILDAHTGRMVNPNLEQYKLAGPRETPTIDVVILEN